MKKSLLLLGAGVLATLSVFAQSSYGVKVSNIRELKNYFRYQPKADVIISAHRGGMMPGYPENCLESCQQTYTMMPTFFEIDFRLTKDSVMVLMHDADIARTTNGKGKVSTYTFDELQKFNLKDRKGKVTAYKVPTLKSVLDWGKGKTVFNFDNKDNNPTSWAYYTKRLLPGGEWAGYGNIMLSVRSIEEALYYWNHGVKNVVFCAEVSSMEMFKAYDASPIPWDHIMAYIRLTVDPNQTELYNKLHEKGVMIMTSITGSSDKIKEDADRKVAYLRELVAEPDIIETDYPSEFIPLPRTRKAIHVLQDQAMSPKRRGLIK